MTSFIALTKHAKEKAYERFRLDENTLLKLAEKSVMYGFSINDAPNKYIRRFLKRKASQGSKVYCCGTYVFIFKSSFVLVTCFPLPKYYLMTL